MKLIWHKFIMYLVISIDGKRESALATILSLYFSSFTFVFLKASLF